MNERLVYINLSEPLGVCPYRCPSVRMSVRSGGVDRSTTRRFASLTYFGEVLLCPHKRVVTMTKMYTSTTNIHVEIIRFRKKVATLMTFFSLKWKHSFATNVLIVTRDESPLVYRAPDSSEDKKFRLLNCTISSYYVQAVRMESQYKRQFGSNSLLFTPFETV